MESARICASFSVWDCSMPTCHIFRMTESAERNVCAPASAGRTREARANRRRGGRCILTPNRGQDRADERAGTSIYRGVIVNANTGPSFRAEPRSHPAVIPSGGEESQPSPVESPRTSRTADAGYADSAVALRADADEQQRRFKGSEHSEAFQRLRGERLSTTLTP